MLNRGMPLIPKICLNYIDVRDVAEAHIKAMMVPEAAGRSLAMSSSPRPWIDVFVWYEKSNIAVTERDPDPKVRKMFITF